MRRLVDHRADTWTQLRQFRLIHGGHVQTYDDVAAYFDVLICPGAEDCLLSPADHRRGRAVRRTIHWTPRRLTRPGLRQFLRLIARVRILRFSEAGPGMRIYMENAWINRVARDLHVRFPVRYSASDRSRVRWLASRGEPLTPAAQRWANRQETSR